MPIRTTTSRRTLLAAAAASASFLALPLRATLAQARPALQVENLNDSLSLFRGAGCNVLVKQADNGDLLIVDGGLERHADALLSQILAQTGAERVGLLINTHWHEEQTGLNHLLGERGVEIFAHENTRLWLGAEVTRPWEERVHAALPLSARPTRGFHHYGELDHAGARVQYGYLRQAHTDGDAWVLLPEDKVLHIGGVASADAWPELDWWTGGWVNGQAQALDTLLALCDEETVIVPAHGPVMTRSDLATLRDIHAQVAERITRLFRAASTPQEAVAARPAAEFEDQLGNADRFVLMAHQSLIAHMTPDA